MPGVARPAELNAVAQELGLSTVLPAIALFLRALVAADTGALADWLASHPADAGWSTWLIRRGLAPYAYHQLQRTGLLKRLASPVQAILRRAYLRAVADAEWHGRELVAVLDALAAQGITPVLFKGAILSHAVYPTPACRPMGDLDLWVTADEMPRAQAALEALGYSQRTKATRPLALQAQRDGEMQMIGRGLGRGLVELHWGVFAGEWLRRVSAIDHD
ncbi:MAG: nucleotidyltransferase family protein, partial [Anaerolineae bacterium]|nr:nucleotidyltransferase family protein [Anaerolineae bacterium]